MYVCVCGGGGGREAGESLGSFIYELIGFIIIRDMGARVESYIILLHPFHKYMFMQVIRLKIVILIYSFYYCSDEGLQTVFINLEITIPFIYFKILQF